MSKMERRELEELQREWWSRHQPFKHPDHPRPVTRRQMLAQGFLASTAMIASPNIFRFLGLKNDALAQPFSCTGPGGGGTVPFIGVDLGGGSNLAASNVLVGGAGGQLDFLSDGGYDSLGLPANQRPQIVGSDPDLGILFHPDSALMKGIKAMASPTTLAQCEGSIVCARSDNDTQNNPHNPIYGINKAGASGALVPLVGTSNSDSGGRSVSPMAQIDISVRPVKTADPGEAMGLVDTGRLSQLLPDSNHSAAVVDAVGQITDNKLGKMNEDFTVEQLIHCAFQDAQNLASVSPNSVDPTADLKIVGNDNLVPGQGSIFLQADLANNRLERTATVMKMVCDGFAGAGTVAFGGYDYHGGTRREGEEADFEAGMAIGAMLEYAAQRTDVLGNPNPTPLMVYVFSDGSLSSNGQIDNTADITVNGRVTPQGGGKGVWTGDNSGRSASLYIVFDPTVTGVRPPLRGGDLARRQIGYYRTNNGAIETGALPISDNVENLAESVVLNYLAIHGRENELDTVLPGHNLGTPAQREALISFDRLAAIP